MRFLKTISLTITLCSLSMTTYSQQLTLEDLIPGGKNYRKYLPERPQQLAWYGDLLTYIKKDTIYYMVPTSKQKEPQKLITQKEINDALQDETLRSMHQVRIDASTGKLLISTDTKYYVLDTATKTKLATFSDLRTASNMDFSSEANTFAYTRENNLYIQTNGGKETAITAETNKDIISGQAVHRNEFGINKGTFWSPQGNLLAFYHMDESMVTDYPLVDVSQRVAKLKNIKYPMAGMKSHQVQVGVFNMKTKKTIFLKTANPKDRYFTNISWSPNEKDIYIVELNREQDSCTLKCYDADSGNLKNTLFSEKNIKYVEPQHPLLFLKTNPTLFIWQSRNNGYNHLFLCSTTNKTTKQLTSGEWEVLTVLGLDEAEKNIYYISNQEDPIQKHIYKLNIKSGKTMRLSKQEGVHTAVLSKSGNYLYDYYTSLSNPGKTSIINTHTGESIDFLTAKNPFKGIIMPEITLDNLKANDGKTDLYYRLVKPTNFDPQKKYPVIVYVYGGPHSQLVDNSWMGQARGWDIYMAQKGYIVFTLDNRGTNNRGLEFENITHCNLGVIETEDQITGIEYLKSLPYVDQNRFGIHGWSFGGFMTLNLMLRHPETFKVGIAGGPVTDWKYYEIMYGERYMSTPQKNKRGYQETSMIDRAGDLKGRLLIIHGDEDPTVVMQHSIKFLKSSIEKGTHPDFFIYPGQEHNMVGRDRVHLYEHITRYFEDFLK